MASTEVVQERLAARLSVRKHAGNSEGQEITFTCGSSMTRAVLRVAAGQRRYEHERKEGAVCDQLRFQRNCLVPT